METYGTTEKNEKKNLSDFCQVEQLINIIFYFYYLIFCFILFVSLFKRIIIYKLEAYANSCSVFFFFFLFERF